MDEQIFVGVDGGGSGCRAIIGTPSRVIGEGRGGPANLTSDATGAIKSVLSALEHARTAAVGVELSGAVAHIGLAGVLTPKQADTVAAAMPFSKVTVTDDRPTALTGALGETDGSVVAIGTDSFIGFKQASTCRFVGGWGLVLGDEASGAWLGRTALAETLRMLDGLRNDTDLANDILAHFNGDPNEIVAFSAAATPPEFGRFAPRVSAAAQDGDVLGLSLMQRAAAYILAALKVLNHQANDPLCLTGELGPAYAPIYPMISPQASPPQKALPWTGRWHLHGQLVKSVQLFP